MTRSWKTSVRHALTASTALVLAACAGVTTVTRTDQYPFYTPNVVQYAIADGELAAEIYGQPFPGAGVDAETIASRLSMPGIFQRARVTTRPTADPNNDHYRLVIAFNPTGTPIARRLCTDPDQLRAGGGSGGGLQAMAAFCAGSEIASQTFVSGAPATGPDDPAFRSAMNQLMLTLFLPEDEGARADCLRRC